MNPLLSIRTVPFQYEMHIVDARFEMQVPQPSADVTRQRGSMEMHHTPAKIHIDSSQARASMGLITVAEAARQTAQKGEDAALDATGQFVREGNQLMDTRNKNAIPKIAAQRTHNSIETMLGFIPSTPAQIDFDPHQLTMQYEMDKLTFDWRTSNRPDMNFVPASIEFKVKDYARLEIEYLGGPNYVPRSSDPNYAPLLPLDARA